MIFDLFLEANFNRDLSIRPHPNSFRANRQYAEIAGAENCVTFNRGHCTTLNRRDYQESFFRTDGRYFWIYGYIYTNNKYTANTGNAVRRLNARELFELKLEHPAQWPYWIKGSYVVVEWDDESSVLNVYTDFLNVLPLYYSFNGKNLIVSSNTAMMLKKEWVDKTPDRLALTMQHLFDYMLGEHYFVKGIRRMENARCYQFGPEGLSKQVYWDVESLKHPELLPKKQSLDLLEKQLKKNVNLYADYAHPVLVSLTGGFDGRTNVAMLERRPDTYKCYSYGMPGSKQVSIPRKVAEHIGINYEPFFLDSNFINKYKELSEMASYFSNGTAPIGFADKPYAYSRLNHYSDTILTGLFGSEILRPLHNNQIQVNDQSFAIFLNDDLKGGVHKAIENLNGFCLSDFNLHDCQDDLLGYLKEHFFDKYQGHDKITRFFFFIIQEGLRKYFSQEISIERVFVTTKIPYFDMDMVELIYQTTWAGMYNGFLGESKFKRRKGQLLYAHIMKNNMPAIMDIEMDRGYNAKALLYPFPLNYLVIGLGVMKAKKYMRRAGGNDTFKTEIWAENVLDQISVLNQAFIDIRLNQKMHRESLQMAERGRYLTYRHMASLKLFLNIAAQ